MARTRRKDCLKRFAVEETLAGFQNVIVGEFTADFVQELHAMMKERTAYDNLSAKRSRWEVSLHRVWLRGRRHEAHIPTT
jgi:hypothetical protein